MHAAVLEVSGDGAELVEERASQSRWVTTRASPVRT